MTRNNPARSGAKTAAAPVLDSVGEEILSKFLEEGYPPSGDGHRGVGTGSAVSERTALPDAQQANQPRATIGPMPIVIVATLVHYTTGLVFDCAVLELDDGFRCPVMVRPPAAGTCFPVGMRVRATKPHAGFLTWQFEMITEA